jgi:hypothetical protein
MFDCGKGNAALAKHILRNLPRGDMVLCIGVADEDDRVCMFYLSDSEQAVTAVREAVYTLVTSN